MEEEQKPAEPEDGHVKIKKTYLLWGGIVLVAGIALFFILKPSSTEKSSLKPPTYQRDEPTQPQIMKEDFQQKIQEMIDSGMTVNEISRETGVRKDLIRKIKKEKAAAQKP